MPRNESPCAALLADARAAVDRADWATADAFLAEHATLDSVGDVEALRVLRRLEDGRGTRRRLLGRVEAFVARHPARAADPAVRVERGLALRAQGEMDAARAELLAARDALRADPSPDPRTLAEAEAGIGLTHLVPLDAERARRALRTARAIAEASALLDLVSHADMYLAYVELEVGDVERATRAYQSALAAYERLGDAAGVRHASYNLGMCLHDLGRDRAAKRHLHRCRELARARSEDWYAAFATIILGELERKAGRAASAEAHYAEAEALFRGLGGPTPTEQAWIDMRRAELALDRGDLRAAKRLARAGLDPRVEPTPQMYGRLITAIVRARTKPTAAAARGLEAVAVDAEAMALNEIAWRARTLAAQIRIALSVERRLDGAPRAPQEADVVAARAHVRRAIDTLEGTIGSMRPRGRARYLRDHVRRAEARALFELEAAIEQPAQLLSPTLGARSAWLALLGSLGEVARADAPIDVVVRALDAIVDLAGARRGYLWIDPRDDDPALHAGRDADRRDLPPRRRPDATARETGGTALRVVVGHRLAVRPDGAGRTSLGLLLLEQPLDGGGFDEERLELVDALATAIAVLVDAARARAHLRARTEAREAEARVLAVELARAEVALGEARTQLEARVSVLDADATKSERSGLLGRSSAMRDVFARLDRLRGALLPVLVSGESGTGKELVARAIHQESPRAKGPFVAVNCGALAESLLESELFGHVRGAFSGATRDAPGLFVVAHDGTLLLDEIGEMSLAMQAKLLRVLQDGEVRPVGAARARKVDVRIVAATHRDLEEMVRARTFREDLFYRLHVLTVHVPPLRARGDDVVLLARRFLERTAPEKRLSPDAAAWLVAQPWPGNVRELRATIEAAAVLVEGDVVHARDLAPPRRAARPTGRTSGPSRLPERLDELEAWAIARALERHGGSRVHAARALGIGRATLYRKLVAYGLSG